MAFARLIDILSKLIDIGRAPVLGVGIDQAAEMVVEGLDHRGGASCDLLGRAADQIDEDQRLGGLFLGETFKNGRLARPFFDLLRRLPRSDDLRVGTTCVSTCSSRWSP